MHCKYSPYLWLSPPCFLLFIYLFCFPKRLFQCVYPLIVYKNSFLNQSLILLCFPGGSVGKESTCNARDLGLIPGLGRSPGEWKATTPVFWPGEFHGLYSPWGCKESDTTERLSLFRTIMSVSCPVVSYCNPMDYSPPGFSVHGISQARTLEWVAIPFSRGSSWPRDQTWVSCITDRFFTSWATGEAHYNDIFNKSYVIVVSFPLFLRITYCTNLVSFPS